MTGGKMLNRETLNITLGVTGSISAYKAVEIMRLFMKGGHGVRVVLTESATHFIGPLTFETFLPGGVYTSMFGAGRDPLAHINLCRDSDLLLIAPATANMIGKMVGGIADDLLSSVFLAFSGPVITAPAMNCHMLDNPAVQDNLARLKSRGVSIIEPETGTLACDDEGRGRLPEPQRIYDYCIKRLSGAVDV